MAASVAFGDELHVAHVDEHPLVLRVPDELDERGEVEDRLAVDDAHEALASNQHLHNLLSELCFAAFGDQLEESQVETATLEVGHQLAGDLVCS